MGIAKKILAGAAIFAGSAGIGFGFAISAEDAKRIFNDAATKAGLQETLKYQLGQRRVKITLSRLPFNKSVAYDFYDGTKAFGVHTSRDVPRTTADEVTAVTEKFLKTGVLPQPKA